MGKLECDAGGRKQRDKRRRRGLRALAAVGMGLVAAPALAANITFAVIGPHEYELPVNFDPFNVFVQYGLQNYASQAYDNSGGLVRGSKQSLFVGLSKYVYFWTFKELPGVGFAYEFITPTVGITGPGTGDGIRGIGDTLTGPAVWIKPTPNTTLGLQNFVQVPIGTYEVTNGYWANYASLFFDAQFPWLSITGNAGAVTRSTQYLHGAPGATPGTTWHANARFGWVNETMVEPFFAVDWQTQSSAYQNADGLILAPNSHEVALGAGLMFKFSPKMSLTVRYSRSVDGKNVDITNAGYFKLAYVW